MTNSLTVVAKVFSKTFKFSLQKYENLFAISTHLPFFKIETLT